MVEPLSLNFRVFTVKLPVVGVRKFITFTVASAPVKEGIESNIYCRPADRLSNAETDLRT